MAPRLLAFVSTLIVCGLFSIPAALADDSTGALSVQVIDAQGHPLENVDVWAVDASSPGQHVVTDRSGYAHFLSLPVGTETIAARNKNYNGCGAFVRIAANQHRIVRIIAYGGKVLCGSLRLVNGSLVQPGVGADVYDIY